MRTLLLIPFLFRLVCAQVTPPPAAITPAPLAPAAPATAIAPETVVAEVDGKKYTAAEMDALMKLFPPQMQMQVRSDVRRAAGYILMVRFLAEQALQANLQNESPLKETLEYQRLGALSQAEINQLRNIETKVTPEQEEKFYKDKPEQFQEARVKVIYVAFSATQPKDATQKTLTEAEARKKIEDLRKQVQAGADFGKLAKANSDDKDSAAKDGDFGLIKHTSPYPDAIKKTVFELKSGQVSEPIRQPNGFYLIRVDDVHVLTFNDVQNQIHEELKQKNFNDYMQNLQKRFDVKVENPAYFASTKPQAPQTR